MVTGTAFSIGTVFHAATGTVFSAGTASLRNGFLRRNGLL
ncbi:hypothetical protein FHS43_002369 [Streptosporangium becharense]|uniref:Uncharacterized protein n=1 Tax=Streptosporangium becharense TaxID=1816182 RepID=A0A7W9IJD5_9ACTN|nr:hypothetical protein [Streptosporangium becharense]MBB5821838.1 hypothetical protein [Streptosporangium becharense]